MPIIDNGPWDNATVTVHIDATQTFTTVIIHGEHHVGVGSAKRNPRDTHNEALGVALALARALRDLAGEIEFRMFE